MIKSCLIGQIRACSVPHDAIRCQVPIIQLIEQEALLWTSFPGNFNNNRFYFNRKIFKMKKNYDTFDYYNNETSKPHSTINYIFIITHHLYIEVFHSSYKTNFYREDIWIFKWCCQPSLLFRYIYKRSCYNTQPWLGDHVIHPTCNPAYHIILIHLKHNNIQYN